MSDEIQPSGLADVAKAEPKLTVANAATDKALAPVSPTGIALVGQTVTRIALALVVVAGAVLALPAAGIQLPPIVLTIATAVVTLGTAFGIASPGVRKESPK